MDLILFLKTVVMGLVEGATEFLPVSSTGHLIIAGEWLHFLDDRPQTRDSFEIIIQLGAILAVVWFYRAKIWEVLRRLGKDATANRLFFNLVLAFLPAAAVGLVAHKWIKTHLFNPVNVAIALVVGGVVILVIEAWKRRVDTETVDDIRPKTAFGIGLCQVLSLVPGTSRSAATILGGVSLGLSRVAATEFSFFLAIPVMFAATGLDLARSYHDLHGADVPVFAVGFIVSFLSALVVIKALLRFVASHTFRGFAWYRIAFGLLLLAWYYLHPAA
ncbi:MAG: Undecaprenyl-diphosphatase [Gemmatimonadetes bacterium]|nr:Undecaprenyl-diphosphatase [Gemmatimonadota bacterium]